MWENSVVPLLLGLGAGVAHTWSGPDHLAAVVPMAAGGGGRAWRTGLGWSLGHVAGALCVAGAVLALRERLDIDALSLGLERLGGVVLVGIGLWSIRRAMRSRVHTHEHTHDGSRHVHIHVHGNGRAHDPVRDAGADHSHGHVAAGIGLLHGAAGVGHLWAALPALAMPLGAAVLYLAGFAAGSVAAMTLLSGLIGRWTPRSAGASARAFRTVGVTAGALAVVVGVWWTWRAMA